jgi:hypothetical protein
MWNRRLGGFAAVVAFAAALFVGAGEAKAQTALGLPPAWQVSVKGDAAAVAAGRLDFAEFIYIDSTSFSGQEIARLGFVTSTLTCAPTGVAGQSTVDCTMTSATWGTVKFSSTVDSTSMTGTMTWTRGATVYTYSFTGVPYTPVAIDS